MDSFSRRQIIIQRMQELEQQQFDCKNCSGTCCTYESNSMMITPLEAVELITYLRSQKMNTEELKQKCSETVKQYRLDHQTGNGRRSYLRRTYTCPFFGHQELGCPLPREVKPYGCLAFNAHHAELKASEFCYSEKNILEKREKDHGEYEEKLNKTLQEKLNLYWEKSPIPLALLELWDKEFPSTL